MRGERTRLRLTHGNPDATSRHVVRTFGEDLWRLTRDDRRWSVDIDAIDRADHSFEVVVRSSMLKRSVALIERLLDNHGNAADAPVFVGINRAFTTKRDA